MSLSVEFPRMSHWMIGYTLWSMFRLSKEVCLLSMPSLTFSLVTYSWDSKSYILTTVYLSSDHPTSSAKPKAQHIILGPLSLHCAFFIYKKNSNFKICHLKEKFKKSQLNFWFEILGFVWAIFERCYVYNIFVTFSQQSLGGKFLLVLI